MTPEQNAELSNVSSLGADLKALRKARGPTLTELSVILGRSVG